MKLMSNFELRMKLDLASSVEERREFIISNAMFKGFMHGQDIWVHGQDIWDDDYCLSILTSDGRFTFFNADTEEVAESKIQLIEYMHLIYVHSAWPEFRDSIVSLHMPSGLVEISSCMFESFRRLEDVQLPSNLRAIRKFAFNNCPSLKHVTIPCNVWHIDDTAFLRCRNLQSCLFAGKSISEVEGMDGYPFGIPSNCIICVS